MRDRGDTYRKLYLPPVFGFPKERKVDTPSETPSNMHLVRIDDTGDEIERLQIQTVPLELSVAPESTWVSIPTLGRNNPFYQYTGGEDTLEFTLDWYSTRENRTDVIDHCRWVESLAKANAYISEPSRVILIYGWLFKYKTWIVEKAPYRLSLFDKDQDMLPRQAYQELTLKLVTDRNRSTSDIKFNL